MEALPDLAVQIGFACLLLVATAFASARFGRRAGPLDVSGWATIVLLALTLCGGGIGALGWIADDRRSFSWDLPPLASRMLAGAGLAFALIAYLALRQPTWERVSLVLLALAAYLVPIGAAALLAHRERFDWHAPITYAFFLIVVAMCLASIGQLASPSPTLVRRVAPGEGTAPPAIVRGVLALTLVVLLPWSIALFVTDDGPTRLVWAWPGDLLTSRLVAVMLLTIAVCAAAGWRSGARARLVLAFELVYAIGVVVAGLVNLGFRKPCPRGYVGAFGVLALLSVTALLRRR